MYTEIYNAKITISTLRRYINIIISFYTQETKIYMSEIATIGVILQNG